MPDVIDRGVIEIVGDARKLRASIEEAKKSIRTLGEGQRDISRQASASIDKYIGSLQSQNRMIGLSARQTELYKLALRGASNEQIKTADAALKFRDAQEKNAQSLQALKSGFIAFGAAAVAAFAGAAIAFDSLVKSASNFQDLAEKTGDTAENLASLAVAAQSSGKSMDEVGQFAINLNKNLVGVDDDAEKAGAAIKALGLELESFKRLSPTDQIETLARTLKQFEDTPDKANVLEALAKGGAQLAPVLNKIAGDVGRQNILTQEQIELADEYATKQAVLRAQIGLHAQAIATEFLPAYADLQGAFLDVLKGMVGITDGASKLASDGSIRSFADNAARAFAFVLDALDGIVRAFQIAGKSIGGFAAVMERVARLDFRGAFEAASAFREDIGAVLNRQTFQGALESRIAARNAPGLTNQTPPQDRQRLNFQGARKKQQSSEDDSARQLARAQLQLDLELIKESGDAQVDAFRRAESIMQALRAAALVNDRDYFASKLGFIQSFAREDEAALQAQVERRQREVFSGKNADKDRLDNEREIAKLQAQIAKIRADAVSRTEINAIEEQAALRKIQQAYLDAKAAAEAYLETIARRNAREIDGIGRGRAFRERQAGLGDIDDRLLSERRRLEGELRRGQIDRTQFEQYLSVAQDTYRREVELYEQRTSSIEAAQMDWLSGASEALQNYIDETRNIAKQTEELFENAFGGLEDLLVDITTNGVKSFKDLKDAVNKLATSIVADINRILIRQNITEPLAKIIQENLGDLGSIFGLPSRGPVLAKQAAAEAKVGLDFFGGAGEAANAAQFSAAVTAAGTSFSASTTTAAATFSAEVAAGGGTLGAELTGAGAALSAELAASGAGFAAQVSAAGSAFAAQVGASSAAGGGADLLGEVIPFLGGFDTGISFVPRNGIAMLHQGERVLTRQENQAGVGGGDINITINAPGATRETTHHMVSELRRELRRNQARGFA